MKQLQEFKGDLPIKKISKSFVVKAAPFSLLCLSMSCADKASTPERPNVILIVSDDQGYGDFSCYNNPILETPNMDKIYEESTRFNNFFVSPVSAPTRAALMTGRYNQRTGVWDTWKGRVNMHKNEYTIAEALNAGGYATGLFGKWHLGYNYPVRPMDQGFDTTYEWEEYAKETETRVNPVFKRNGKIEKRKGFLTDIIFDEAMQWIEDQTKKEEPFFAYVASFLPHTCDSPQVMPRYVEPFLKYDTLVRRTAEVYGMVTKLDECVGRLMAKVQELGLDENTLIIYLSDNGPQMHGPGHGSQKRYNLGMRGSKGNVYDGGIRVPCFFRWPGHFEAGKEIDGIAAHIDLMPTILDICRVDQQLPNPIDGISLLPVIKGKKPIDPNRNYFVQLHRTDKPELWNNTAMRNSHYKLVEGDELYDIQNDPGEKQNIAASHPEVLKKMRTKTEDWFEDVSSSRGYVTSPLTLGSQAQKKLNLQYWNRNDQGWPLNVINKGPYKITVQNVQPQLFPNGGNIVLQFGDQIFKQPIKPNMKEMVFQDIKLDTGSYYFTIYTEGYKIPHKGRWNQEDLGYRNIGMELK